MLCDVIIFITANKDLYEYKKKDFVVLVLHFDIDQLLHNRHISRTCAQPQSSIAYRNAYLRYILRFVYLAMLQLLLWRPKFNRKCVATSYIIEHNTSGFSFVERNFLDSSATQLF